ncbi:MAG: peptidase S1 [Brevundimonas sp.]|uniref:peptidase S1 n=1 Tax=Brevundimonas sp. TaxID=1871086 RepID=UPI00391D42E7
MKNLFAAAFAALIIAGPVAAQDYSASPNYGTARLSAGFTPDPYNVTVTAGGSIRAADRFSSCRGYISNAPDLRLHWSGGGNLPLIISVSSSRDTTLVVNGPDGSWYCDDDGGEGTNPALRFGSPRSGQYDIWVGSYGGDYVSATLSISELYSH